MKTITALALFLVATVLMSGCAAVRAATPLNETPDQDAAPALLESVDDVPKITVTGDLGDKTRDITGNGFDFRDGTMPSLTSVRKQVNAALDKMSEESGTEFPHLNEKSNAPLTDDELELIGELRDLGLIGGPDIDQVLGVDTSSEDSGDEESSESEEEVVVEEPKKPSGIIVGGDIADRSSYVRINGGQVSSK